MKKPEKKPEEKKPYCPAQVKMIAKEAEDRAMDKIRRIAERVWKKHEAKP